jgi:hypothetical protein
VAGDTVADLGGEDNLLPAWGKAAAEAGLRLTIAAGGIEKREAEVEGQVEEALDLGFG